jgi:hypothetical protein
VATVLIARVAPADLSRMPLRRALVVASLTLAALPAAAHARSVAGVVLQSSRHQARVLSGDAVKSVRVARALRPGERVRLAVRGRRAAKVRVTGTVPSASFNALVRSVGGSGVTLTLVDGGSWTVPTAQLSSDASELSAGDAVAVTTTFASGAARVELAPESADSSDTGETGDDPSDTGDDPSDTGDDPSDTGDDPSDTGDDPSAG